MTDEGVRDEFGRLRKDGEGNHNHNGRDYSYHRDEDNNNNNYNNNYDERDNNYRRYDNDRRDHNDDHDDWRDNNNNNGRHGHGHGDYHGDHDNDRREESTNNCRLYYGPAHESEEALYPGLVVKGEVCRVEPYGAFVEFSDNSGNNHRGLIHISQLASHRVEQVSDVLQLKETLYTVVLDVEQGQRRIRLSLRDVDQDTGLYSGPDLRPEPMHFDRKGRIEAPSVLREQRAKERRHLFCSFHSDWKKGSTEWETDDAPLYLRTLWCASPEPPSAAALPPPSKKPPPAKADSQSSSDSSSSDSSSSSDDNRLRRRDRKRSRSRRSSKDKRKSGRKGRSSRRTSRRRNSDDSSSSSSSSGSSGSSSSEQSRDAKKSKPDVPQEQEAAQQPGGKEDWKESDWNEAQDMKRAVQGETAASDDDDEDDEGPMPLPNSNAAGGAGGKGNSSYGGALLPGEGQAIAQYVQQNLRIPRRGEIGYSGDDIEHYENSGFVMSGSRHKRMNAVRIRKENQVYSAEEQRALALLTMEENQQKEAQLMEDFRIMLKEKQKMREKA